ncbi:ENTH/ANTH/VHS superfamily protein [Rhynchospora pubera]|uniref:ENTH/ANTH/VHS superfamily protein n=1 Tax=Rhynchospora pubera TaxID=906938 RepID=A0AAV8EFP4_9POAL|nr:ENTH/ANTH/VHS superfamily protein [Rhynchospora pubera]
MSGIRSALGAIKDQTSISIAKVSSNSSAPEIDVLVVKATSHDAEPAEDRHIREILSLTSGSPVHIASCVAAISRRISRTRDWVVALKSLSLVHRLISDGSPTFRQEILYATRRGARLLNLSDFRDEAHSASWDHSTFVRTYALFLDQRLEFLQYDTKTSARSNSRSSQQSPRDRWDDNYSDPNTTDPYYRSPIDERRNGSTSNGVRPLTPVRDMKPERLIGRMHQLQQLLDRFLACRPTGAAKHNRLILISLYLIVKDSFQIYADICEVLAVLLDRFFEMEYQDCVKAFEAHVSAAKQIDELIALYAWCKDVGVARSSEYPEVQRITEKLLESLDEFVRDRAKRAKSPPRESKPEPSKIEEPQEPDMNSIKALPAPEPKPEPEPEPVKVEPEVKDPTPAPQMAPVKQPDLVDLREENNTADAQGNKLALALFSGPPAGGKGEWEAFPSDKDEVTSAWQTPAAEPGKADWELALVETASNLSKQKASMGGGMDPLLLNGMYDQGIVRQHVSGQAGSVGSASSVALPGPAHAKTQMLALPAPDGSMQTVGGDPFAASLSVPPPAYVQMAEVEKKQQLLVQEQMMWQQYQQGGMQGQVSLNKLSNGYGYVPNPAMPYGMPTGYNPAGGYYPTY